VLDRNVTDDIAHGAGDRAHAGVLAADEVVDAVRGLRDE
jgi:hypothetical protein